MVLSALRSRPAGPAVLRTALLTAAVLLPLAACQSDESAPAPQPQPTAAAQPRNNFNAPAGQTQTPASVRAGRMIDQLSKRAIDLLTGPQLAEAQRQERFRVLLRQNFAINQIGIAVLDKAWKTATDQQQKQYLDVFEDWIVQTYGTRFREYSGQTIAIAGTYESDRGKRDRFVQTDITDPATGEVVRVDWRIRDIAGDDKIIDVMVAGTSMLVTQRSEFGAVVDAEGGVQGLINKLRQRVGG